LPVQPTKPRPRILVTADGEHLVGHAGSLLLAETADTVGLTSQLGRRANLGVRAGARDRGVVLRDLVVMLADGGDGFGDLAALRDQPELFGEVCSVSTAWRVVAEELPADPRGVAELWSALGRARETAWELGAVPPGPLVIDIDATLVAAHSDKQGAAPTYKHGFGFHPLAAYLDRGDGTGEALAGILRPGNAGSNTAADHVQVLALALLALPKPARSGPILVRADSAGATHAFVEELARRGLEFSIGFPMEADVKAAILATPADGWLPAADQHGHQRPGAWVGELTGLDRSGWPPGTRAICRRERPHPGARHKMTFTDPHGHRFQVFITNQPDPDIVALEARHRAHARVEDRIRGAKATGLRNLPCYGFAANDAWLTLVACAQTLVCWTQALCLSGELAIAEPATLRYRLWHTAGRLVRHGRQVILRLQRTWPWTAELVAAFARLRALPARC
jgi:hypothetical protein